MKTRSDAFQFEKELEIGKKFFLRVMVIMWNLTSLMDVFVWKQVY